MLLIRVYELHWKIGRRVSTIYFVEAWGTVPWRQAMEVFVLMLCFDR